MKDLTVIDCKSFIPLGTDGRPQVASEVLRYDLSDGRAVEVRIDGAGDFLTAGLFSAAADKIESGVSLVRNDPHFFDRGKGITQQILASYLIAVINYFDEHATNEVALVCFNRLRRIVPRLLRSDVPTLKETQPPAPVPVIDLGEYLKS